MLSPSDAPQSLLARALLALAALAVAALFGGLLIRILFAPIDDAPGLTGWFLRGFVFFMFGTIAAGALSCAYRLFIPAREPPLPPALFSRCPACGERWRATKTCASCGEPRAACAGAWRVAPRSPEPHPFFLGGIGAALFFLGLLLASMSAAGRGFNMVAYALLALLMLLIGGAIVWASMLSLRDQWRARGKRDFTLHLRSGPSLSNATAHLERGALSMRGSTWRWLELDQVQASQGAPAPREPTLRALIKTLAVFHARGELSLSHTETITWRFDGALHRERSIDVNVCLPGLEDEDYDDDPAELLRVLPPSAAQDPVLSSLAATSVRKLAEALADSTELQAAFEQYAAGLPAEEVDEHTKAVLTDVLRGGQPAAGAPYRAQG